MKRTYIIGGIVAAAVIAGGGAATGVALAGSGTPTGAAYGAPAAAATAATPATTGVGTAALEPGTALVDGAGRALYLFEADNGTTSNCNGQCAQVWPPALVGDATPTPSGDAQAALLGTTTRADGAKQVTYNGHPLYYFVNDKAAGDARGQGINRFGGGWYVVDPTGNKIDPDDEDAPTAAPAPANSGGYGY
jgi:predicted lipoprotein with Yx(FWY)xxD motif